MAIEFNCPSCGAAIRVPDAAAGAKGSCPTCQTKLLVPQIVLPPDQGISPSPTPIPPAPQPGAGAPLPFDPALPNPVAGLPRETGVNVPFIDVTTPPVLFPGSPFSTPAAAGQPVVPVNTSVASRVRRRAKGKKSGLWFPILCGLALVGGMAWLYIGQLPNLNGERAAVFIKGEALPPKIVDKSLIDVSTEVRTSVLNHFTENRERLKSQLVETQFAGNEAGLEIQILTGSETRFVRFPIDDDLRTWYTDNYDQLESSRSKSVRQALKDFFNDWDVAVRNQQGVEDFAVYRDSVGLASSVDGLGFNVCARIDQSLYPCVYEDEGALYFLLPPSTQKFKLVGARVDGKTSYFPGEYDVTIKSSQN
jgi:hypothetical protein